MQIKKYLLCFTLLVMITSALASTYYEENFTSSLSAADSSSSNLQIQILRYEPYPVAPGEYFTLYIKVECSGTTSCKNVVFELDPSYPFSVDDESQLRTDVGTLINGQPIVLEYKVRVNESAVSGSNQITFLYGKNGNIFLKKPFNITIEDVQTKFDAIVQDYSSGEVSIAIANIGANDANSMIVRIPEQKGFSTSGTNAQMLGNLDAGDYTVTGFSVNGDGNALIVQIDYTDSIGERRTEYLNLSFSTKDSGVSSMLNGTIPNGTLPNGTSDTKKSNKTLLVVVIIIVCGAGFFIYRHIKKSRSMKGNSKK